MNFQKELEKDFSWLTREQLASVCLYKNNLEKFKDLLITKVEPEKQIASLLKDALISCPLLLKKLPANAPLVEIGSGAGFIGIILAILSPEARKITLVEPSEKRSEFLMHSISTLVLEHCVKVKTEVFKPTKAPFLIFKAVAEFKKTLKMLNKFTVEGSCSYHFKSSAWKEDWKSISEQDSQDWNINIADSYHFEDKERFIIELKRKSSI